MGQEGITGGGFRPETREQAAARARRELDMSKTTVYPAREETYFRGARKTRVAIYTRVSTDGISQVTSFELQRRAYLSKVASRPDWQLVGIYSDEGISATSTAHREGLLQLIEDVQQGRIDMVLTKSVSRLSRNMVDAITIITGFRNLDPAVGILFESDNIYTLDRSMDIYLHILVMLAEEESHKKSTAMLSSYAIRFSTRQYMMPDCLGFSKAGINELKLDTEEAATFHLMETMYLAGYHPRVIAETLTELGRKTHTHVYRDGREKEGIVKWSPSGIVSYLKNERRCGDVRSQKTFTVDFKTHQSRSNDSHRMTQHYTEDNHEAIVTRDEYRLGLRLIDANRGGWNRGLPEMELVRKGALKGFAFGAPDWMGFGADDYNRACLSAYGITDEALDMVEQRIFDALDEADKGVPATEFQHVYRPSQQEFRELLSEYYEEKEETEPEEEPETFAEWTDRLGKYIIADEGTRKLNEDIINGNREDILPTTIITEKNKAD